MVIGKYGEAAVLAAKIYREGASDSPADAWKQAVEKIFTSSDSSQDKGCPKDIFLGLCEEGLISGIPPGNYSRSSKNRGYAVKAVEILKVNPFISTQSELLWAEVAGKGKSHNHQMNVVVSLWGNDIVRS